MPRARVTIQRGAGLHARPAAEFVKLANRFTASTKVRLNGRQADAKSILGILGLGANGGAEVELEVEGEDAEPALAALRDFLETPTE
ncbi:HPr family phosphocarrier protein [bacterium]|nr:MAG: HPr family phosphocarrier protein [bacterium]